MQLFCIWGELYGREAMVTLLKGVLPHSPSPVWKPVFLPSVHMFDLMACLLSVREVRFEVNVKFCQENVRKPYVNMRV